MATIFNNGKADLKVSSGLLADVRKVPTSTAPLKTLLVLVRNVAKDPTNTKFHSIKLSNPKIQAKLCTIPQCVAFLQAMGFAEGTDEEGNRVLRLSPETIDAAAFQTMTQELEQVVEARSGGIPVALQQQQTNVVHSKIAKKNGGMSLKEQARLQRDEREKNEQNSRLAEKAKVLKQMEVDKNVRKNDPNWKSGVSAAAGKGGKAMPTFRDKFGEDGGG
jgi:hypothetical protein